MGAITGDRRSVPGGRIIAVLIALALLITVFNVSALAAEGHLTEEPLAEVPALSPQQPEPAGTVWAPKIEETPIAQKPSMWDREGGNGLESYLNMPTDEPKYPYYGGMPERSGEPYPSAPYVEAKTPYPTAKPEGAKYPDNAKVALSDTQPSLTTYGETPIVPLDTGGPDLWGYVWEDSNAPAPTVPYFWNDISGTGINSGLAGDDQTVNIPVGFNFDYYGNTYSDINVCTNGFVQFGGASAQFWTDPIPTPGGPDNMICAFWSDLWNPGATGSALYYQTIGVAPNQAMIIQFNNWDFLGGGGGMYFQVILNETGEIWCIYNTIWGGAATGIENIDGSDGLAYPNGVANGLAILYYYNPPLYRVWVSPDIQTGFGNPGMDVDHVITVSNLGLNDDTYDLSYVNTILPWPVTFRDIGDTVDITTIFVTAGNNDQFIARVGIPGGAAPGDFDITDITATSQNDPVNAWDQVGVFTQVGGAPFLLVDDDGGINCEQWFDQAFADNGWAYNYFTTESSVPSAAFMSGYEAVVWTTGDFSGGGGTLGSAGDTLSPAERVEIEAFLDGGGRLYMSSGGLGWDGEFNGWASWINNVFGASAYNGWTSSTETINGVAGDPVGDGMTFQMHTGDSCPSLSGLLTWNNLVGVNTWASFQYSPSGEYMATRNNNSATGSKTVYTAFDLADVDGQVNRGTLLHRALTWLLGNDTPSTYGCDLTPDYQFDYGLPGTNIDYILTLTNTGSTTDTYDLGYMNNNLPWPVTFYQMNEIPVFTNPSFETGDLTGWVAQDMDTPYDFLHVGSYWPPTDGIFAACNGFDGGGPDTIILAQDVFLPANIAIMEFDYRAWWQMSPYGGTQDRLFTVEIEPLGGGPAMQSDVILVAPAGSDNPDTGHLHGSVNLATFTGTSVRISFEWYIPETFTGPAGFQLDNIRVYETLGAPITSVGPISPGDSVDIIARVTIPSGALPGDFDIADIYATSQGDPMAGDWAQVHTEVPPFSFELNPEYQSSYGYPGWDVAYQLTITNTGPEDIYDLWADCIWPVEFYDMAWNPIWSIGPVPGGSYVDFYAVVSIPGGASPGDFDIADIYTVSWNDPAVWDMAQVQTQVPYVTNWLDDFEDGWDSWSTEVFRQGSPETHWEMGDPMGAGPGSAYSGSNCAGTNLWDWYYPSADITLVSPFVELGSGTQILSFQTWYEMDTWGDDGGFVEINDGMGWTQIWPTTGYPYSGYTGGYWTDSFSGISAGWEFYEFDLSAYAGQVIQVRFHFAASDWWGWQWGWYLDDVFMGSPIVINPVMVIDKTGPAVANPGEVITYQIDYMNIGDDWAYNVWVTETYPVGVTYISSSPMPDIGNSMWYLGDIAPGAGGTIFIDIMVTDINGTLLNYVQLDYMNWAGEPYMEWDYAETTIINPLVVIDKIAPATANPGETITYTITCTNIGTDWAYDVIISEMYPPEVSFITSVPLPTFGDNIWVIPILAPGSSFTITITVEINAMTLPGTILENWAMVDYQNAAGIPQPTEYASAITLVISPDMVIEKSAPETANPGDIITYWITYENIGTDWAYNVVITETYPAGVTFVSCIPAPNIGNNVWIIGGVPPGASGSIEITVQINLSTVGVITNFVTLDYENGAGIPQLQESASADTMIAFQLRLEQGWNLFSFPLIPTDPSLDAIFGDQLTGGLNQGQSDKVFKWNPVAEEWLVAYLYEDGIPGNAGWLFVGGQEFTMEPDFGYWVWIREDLGHPGVTFNIFGAIPGERNVPLSVGWNLVGYTSVIPLTLTGNDTSGLYASGFTGGTSQTTSDRIFNWDGTGWQVAYMWTDGYWLGTTFDLTPGKGYWIEIREGHDPFTWTYGGG